MLRKSFLFGMLLVLSIAILLVTACGSKPAANGTAGTNPAQSSAAVSKAAVVNPDSVTAKQTLIAASVNGATVSIPVNDVEKLVNTRFKVDNGSQKLSFMAYQYNNQTFVRADICPPCRSESFTMTKGTLVCDTCGTVFNAKTGAGVKGACVQFDKQSVPFEVKDGNMVMTMSNLTAAYQGTLNPGQ